uniref:Uncharacterized protein n=1 Tax=Oryza sativa subsp. japonica TaxID=39947 RepID=Q6K4N8_ORYSJ|nr:hypothetical protein [Oryza sativa Japonica Group]
MKYCVSSVAAARNWKTGTVAASIQTRRGINCLALRLAGGGRLEREQKDGRRCSRYPGEETRSALNRAVGEAESRVCAWSQAICILVTQRREPGRANRSIPRSSMWHPSGAGLQF